MERFRAKHPKIVVAFEEKPKHVWIEMELLLPRLSNLRVISGVM